MDFVQKYNNRSLFDCNYQKIIKIKYIAEGHGGSNNLVIIGKVKGMLHVLKIIPYIIKRKNQIKRSNRDQNEIKFYKFLTENFLLTELTPHIVGIYNFKNCSNLKSLIKSCPTFEQSLLHKQKENKICKLHELLYDWQMINTKYQIVNLEYCPIELSSYLEKIISSSTNSLISFLNRLLFQLCFTLTIIQDKYPYFIHGDFFIRNMLGIEYNNYKKNDVVEYKYRDMIFHLPANGLCIKINDFGLSRLGSTIKDDVDYYKNSIDHYSDFFNILHDLYDGQQLGTTDLMTGLKSKKQKEKIKKFFSVFFKIKIFDKINTNNKSKFNYIWRINQHPKLVKILNLKTPKEYLDHFQTVFESNKNNNIVHHYTMK